MSNARRLSSHRLAAPAAAALSLLAFALPARAQRITEFNVPLVNGLNGQPYGITHNPAGGNLAFTLTAGNKISFISTTGSFGSPISIPTASSAPFFICVGPTATCGGRSPA